MPTPSGKQRIKEYLYSNPIGKINGGVERFKLELHAKNLKESAIIGYIQKNNISYWQKTINSWVDELVKNSNHPDILWTEKDKLVLYKMLRQACVEKFVSENLRKSKGSFSTGPIILYHYFLVVCD